MPFSDIAEATKFSEREFNTLVLICDTLIPQLVFDDDPHGFYERSASDVGVPPRLATLVEEVSTPILFRELQLFLRLIEVPLVNGILCRDGRAFSEMELEARTGLLFSWQNSRFNRRRKAFQSLKRLAMMLFYGMTEDGNDNPNWVAIGYDGLPEQISESSPTTIKPLAISEDTTLYADVIVIGSGAGGGVVAAELSAAGLDVIVVEKGSYYTETDFDGNELSSAERFLKRRGYSPLLI